MKKLLGVILALFMAVGLVAANVGTESVYAAEAEYTITLTDKSGDQFTVTKKLDLGKGDTNDENKAKIFAALGLDVATTEVYTIDLTKKGVTINLKDKDVCWINEHYIQDTVEVEKVSQKYLTYVNEAVGEIISGSEKYDADGWYSDSGLTTAVSADEKVGGDVLKVDGTPAINVYTKATLKTFTVTFVANGGQFKENLNQLTLNDKAVVVDDAQKTTKITVKVPYGTTIADLIAALTSGTDTGTAKAALDGTKSAHELLTFIDTDGYVANGTKANFKGWATAADSTTDVTTSTDAIKADKTFYAIWDKASGAKYDLKYDGNDNDDLIPGISVTVSKDKQNVVIDRTDLSVDDSVVAAYNKYEAEGFTFAGWNTAKDGSGLAVKEGETVKVSDLAKYAKPAQAVIDAVKAAAGAGYTEDDVTAYVEKGTSGSKSADESLEKAFASAKDTVTDNDVITLYAQWTAGEYTITYYAGKDNEAAEQKVTMGKAYTTKGEEYDEANDLVIGWIAFYKDDVDYLTKTYDLDFEDVADLIVKINLFMDNNTDADDALELTEDEYKLYLVLTTLDSTDADPTKDTQAFGLNYGKLSDLRNSITKGNSGKTFVKRSDLQDLSSVILNPENWLASDTEYTFDWADNMVYLGVWASMYDELVIEYRDNGQTLAYVLSSLSDDSKAPEVAEKEGYTFKGWKYYGFVDYTDDNGNGTLVVDGKVKSYAYVKEAVWEKNGSSEEAPVNSDTVYRLYNPNTGEHLFTTDANEVSVLVPLGWTNEGVAWYSPSKNVKDVVPVYRLYNPNVEGGEHHYTIDVNEMTTLVSLGWKSDGVVFYSYPTTSEEGVNVYRVYNSNAYSNNHHFTTDKNENDTLVSYGWTNEGDNAFRVVKAGK